MKSLTVLAALICVFLTVVKCFSSSTGCSLWHYRSAKNSCVCGRDWNRAVFCSGNQSLLLRIDHALGIIKKKNDPKLVIGVSPFTFIDYKIIDRRLRVYYMLNISDGNTTELTEKLCRRNNREGFLCESCRPGYGPSPYNPKCQKCHLSLSKAVAIYLTIKIIPIAALFFLIMTFRIDLIKGPMLGYIFFCQLHVIFERQLIKYFTIIDNVALQRFLIALFYLSSIWNLDFLQITHIVPPFCISPKLNDYDMLLLNCASYIIPLCLVFLIYIFFKLHELNFRIIVFCWKPFHPIFVRIRRNWNLQDSIIHSYSSLYIISFPMLIYNTLLILRSTDLLGVHDIIKRNVLIYHPSVHWHDDRYIYSSIAVFLLLICLGGLPSLLLLLYPMRLFRLMLQRCCFRKIVIKVNTFVQTFQGPFKDGSNGTSDFRIIPGLIGSLMILLAILNSFENSTPYSSYLLPSLPPCFAVASVLCAYAHPCKTSIANLSLTFHCVWIAGICALLTLWTHTPDLDTDVLIVLFCITVPAPHIFMIFWAFYQLEKKALHLRQRCVACFVSVMGETWLGKRLETPVLPDRLLNSVEYRELT